MKIYIPDYSLSKLKTKISSLKKYLVEEKSKFEVISNEGQYYIDNSKVYKIVVIDKGTQLYEKYYEDLSLLIDKSYSVLTETNQVPNHNIEMQNTYFYFALNKTTKLRFVIKTQDETIENINNMSPYDFYFEIDGDVEINNIFFRDEINVFLSLLN
jgi:hypothetical protein